MHAIELLQKCLRSALAPMHARRRESLLGSIVALIRGKRLVLMDLARSWPGIERVAAPLKRIDHLLSNVPTTWTHYRPFSQVFGRGCRCIDVRLIVRWLLLRSCLR